MNARVVRIGTKEALALGRSAREIVAVRGKNVVRLASPREANPTELLEILLGRTGNLRAPTARVGGLLLVGFSVELYESYGHLRRRL